MPAPLYLQLEAEVARAHRSMSRAAALCDSMNGDGCRDDCEAIAIEIARLQESLLRGLGSSPRTISGKAYRKSLE
jgi:hypothetical protein